MGRGANIVVSCDWLAVSIKRRLDTFQVPQGFTVLSANPTKVWQNHAVIYDQYGEKFATVLSSPRSSLIESNRGVIEIANRYLYSDISVAEMLSSLGGEKCFDPVGVSRIDLCADFFCTPAIRETIMGLYSGSIYVSQKRNGSAFWSYNESDRLHPMWQGCLCPHQQSWGHKTSHAKWKLYYKSKELLDAGDGQYFEKPYIVDKWRAARLDVSNVWRLEVSLSAATRLKVDDAPLTATMVDNPEWLVSTFRGLYDRRFIVRYCDGHTDRRNDRDAELLNFSTSSAKSRLSVKPSLAMAGHSGRISLLRHLVTSLEEPEVLLDRRSREDVIAHIRQLVTRDYLENYCRRWLGKSLNMWIAEKTETVCDLQRSTEIFRNHLANRDLQPNARFDMLPEL